MKIKFKIKCIIHPTREKTLSRYNYFINFISVGQSTCVAVVCGVSVCFLPNPFEW